MSLLARFTKGVIKQTRYINLSKMWSGSNSQTTLKTSESQIQVALRQRFPDAKEIAVQDISGGCGAMFNIHIKSDQFKNMPLVKQHMLVNETLKEQIRDMHGIRITTSAAEAD